MDVENDGAADVAGPSGLHSEFIHGPFSPPNLPDSPLMHIWASLACHLGVLVCYMSRCFPRALGQKAFDCMAGLHCVQASLYVDRGCAWCIDEMHTTAS